MKLANLAEGVLVADQITVNDLKTLAEQGVKTIVCHRPDGEGADQPNFDEISKAAKQFKIKTHYLPVISGKIIDDDVTAYSKLWNASSNSLGIKSSIQSRFVRSA
jgi:sulfide:quinone oxidoreductase